jgi:hypothetical protein
VNDLLGFLVRYCSFLWADARYRITDSEVTTSFGGDSWLTIASEALQMRFVRDRGQLFLEFREADARGKAAWYSIDLFRRLITGERQASAELDEGYATFLRQHLVEIESLFSEERLPETRKRLHDLMRLRSKELFG